MLRMNRETRLQGSDTLIVVDRSRRRRNIIIAAVAGLAIILIALMLLTGGKKDEAAQQAGAGGGGGQIPTVSVVVPGRSEVARTITASGALAARRDQPIGVAGEGGRVTAVLVDQGSWVRAGQVLAVIDRSVQTQNLNQLAAQIQVARADAALAQNEGQLQSEFRREREEIAKNCSDVKSILGCLQVFAVGKPFLIRNSCKPAPTPTRVFLNAFSDLVIA